MNCCTICGNTAKNEIETYGVEYGYDEPLTVCKEGEGCSE